MTQTEGKVKFAVIGCGRIGKRHAAIIAENPDAELVALCDIREEAAKEVEEYGAPFYLSVDKMLDAHDDLDVVSIATPNGLHAAQGIQVLDKGVHVLIEKPLSLKKSDAEKVIYTALHRNRHVFAVMQNRYSPPSAWVKRMVESGKLGRINLVQVNCYWNRDERYYTGDSWHGRKDLDGGTLFTQFSHFVDTMYWLFGDIANIRARITDFNHEQLTDFEDTGTVSFDFVNGGMGVLNFSTSCWDQNFESSLTIIAEHGTIKIGGQYMDKVEYCHVKDYEMEALPASNPPNAYGGYKGSAANHGYVIQNVVDVLRRKGTITTNALEGLKVVDIIERIYAAALP